MTNALSIETERVDDIPLLLAQIEGMGIPELLETHFGVHGNWIGTGLGWTTGVWMARILSQGDHRLSWAEQWVGERVETLERSTGELVLATEWSDDRLGIILDLLSEEESWQAFESALNRRTIRVYNLKRERVRLDSTTASGHWEVTEEGLFQFGHSKDHRPDLPQLKIMLSTLDPLGMPVATQVVSGETADDPLYVPAIKQVRDSLDVSGLLYVGDSKMAALATRAFVQEGGDQYLCPLPKTQISDTTLADYLAPVWADELEPTPIFRTDALGERKEIAVGFEREVTMTHQTAERVLTWTERRLVVRSHQFAKTSEGALRKRLETGQAELMRLNERKRGKKRLESHAEMEEASQAILKHHRIQGLMKVTVYEQVDERPLRAYRERPAGVRIKRTFTLQAEVDEAAVQTETRSFGWRVYATNSPLHTLSLEQAVVAYREEFLIERGFGRLKGKQLSLTPMYLQSDKRATGLIHLLSICLRVLVLLEFQLRRRLAEDNERLAGLYAGNPKRSTSRPTAEMLLQAFQNITLAKVVANRQRFRHLTPLSDLQKKILALLGIPTLIYDRLAIDSS
jgi:transposase